MSQFTNWLIETHPEYIKGSRIFEQTIMLGKGRTGSRRILTEEKNQRTVLYPIQPYAAWATAMNPANKGSDYYEEAHRIDKHYHVINPDKDFFLTKQEEDSCINHPTPKYRWTKVQLDKMLEDAKDYMNRPDSSIGAWGNWEKGKAEASSMIFLMKLKGWEWIDTYKIGQPGYLTNQKNLLVKQKSDTSNDEVEAARKEKEEEDKRIAQKELEDLNDKRKQEGKPPLDKLPEALPEVPKPEKPKEGKRPSLEEEDADDAAFKVARKKALDDLNRQMAQVEARKQADIVRKQKEKAAAVSATKPPGAGGGVPPGAGGGVPPGATGGGVPPGATGGGAADDIFLKPPEKVSPNLQKYDQYHLRNRPKISNAMAGVVEHLSKHGLEVYVNGRSLTIMDDTQETPVPIHKGLLDNAEHDSAIYKELWKASLNPKVNTQLGGEDLQQVLRRFGFNKMDFSDYNVQTPDQLKSRSSYGAAPIPKYNADDLNKGNQFWRIK
jgi:hypothetical protein